MIFRGLQDRFFQIYIITHLCEEIPYKWKFSRVSNFAILWSKVVSLFSRVQFFANLKIHKILIPEIWLFKGVKAEDEVIPVYLLFISVSIDLPVHICIQVNQLFMKKIFKHLNLFIYRIFKDVLANFMTTILSIKLIVVYTLTRKHKNRTKCFECSGDR